MPKGYPKDGRPPGNIEALKKWREKTQFRKDSDRAREAGAKGNETQRQLRAFKEILTEQITEPALDREKNPVRRPDGSPATIQDQLAKRLVASVMAGDMGAYALMLKLIDQYPEEHARVTVDNVPKIIDDIRPMAPRPKGGGKK